MRWTAPFQSTPPARGATKKAHYHVLWRYISIHAPREGGDSTAATDPVDLFDFNPRPPRGGRPGHSAGRTAGQNFNPRPPRGGRRQKRPWADEEQRFQSTPPARGATDAYEAEFGAVTISIHAPREGGDAPPQNAPITAQNFNPRPPRGGRLCFVFTFVFRMINFNPRPPRGGRRRSTASFRRIHRFQSTPPARGATQ